MQTYQDLMRVPENDDKALIDFVRSVIDSHRQTADYKTAVMGEEYNRKRNTTILAYEKTLTRLDGSKVLDRFSANHKTTRNFFKYFTTQQTQFLLGNGVTWGKDETEDKLSNKRYKFDTQLQKAGKKALVQGTAFGFYNLDHIEVFGLTEFAPLYDEENGALMAGVRFWQIDSTKPLRATLYAIDGYTDFIWGYTDDNKVKHSEGKILHEKRPYILKYKVSEADGLQIYDGLNYPSFPIVPFYANEDKQSELVGIQEQIDAYDLIKNGFLNDLDTAQLYWIIKGAGGMDDTDLVKFLERLHTQKVAQLDDDQEAHAETVQIPYEAREKLLDRIEKDLYRDYMALNVDEIKGGAVTATQIEAAYEPLNSKCDEWEYCVSEFIEGILAVAGIDDTYSFTRSILINVNESVSTVLSASEVLDDEYTTEKVLTLLGDGDKAEEVLERMQQAEYDRNMEEPAEPTETDEISTMIDDVIEGL